MSPVSAPFFSVVVGAFNRQDFIDGCIRSCLDQSFPDFEVIVVDDGSVDRTAAVVAAFTDPSVRLVRHEQNRGIGPARHTGVLHARGSWIVTIDSDWQLLPHALERFRHAIDALPSEIAAIGARLRWDTGQITPRFVPAGPIDYEGRLRWIEAEGGTDNIFCARAETYKVVTWSPDRRGGVEALYQLDFCSRYRQYFLDEILGLEFAGAPNSHSRAAGDAAIRGMLLNAPDIAAQSEELLARHGDGLQRFAPSFYDHFLLKAGMNRLLGGERLRGAAFCRAYLRRRPTALRGWAVLLLGLASPSALARATVRFRRHRDRRGPALGQL